MKINKLARQAFEIADMPALWKLIAEQATAQIADDMRDMRDVDMPLEVHGREGALLSPSSLASRSTPAGQALLRD